MFPLPCFSVPSHTADPVRVAIVCLLWLFRVKQAIVPAILTDRNVCLTSISADAHERNSLFDLSQDCHLERSERSLIVAPRGIAGPKDLRLKPRVAELLRVVAASLPSE